MLSLVRAVTSGRGAVVPSTALVTRWTASIRSARKDPSASPCDIVRPSITAPSPATPATLIRSAVPTASEQAVWSFSSLPVASSAIFLVNGPFALVSRVSVISSGGGGGGAAASTLTSALAGGST